MIPFLSRIDPNTILILIGGTLLAYNQFKQGAALNQIVELIQQAQAPKQ